jgi:hypothetical protein
MASGGEGVGGVETHGKDILTPFKERNMQEGKDTRAWDVINSYREEC